MANQPEVVLHYSQGDSGIKDFHVTKPDVLIGRASECDIHLDDPEVSRFHASLRIAPDGLWLLDMDSKNGTRIGDKAIDANQRIQLRPDQNFSIGSFTFKATIPRAASSDATILAPGMAHGAMYDLDALRQTEFPHMLNQTNLDNAASAPTPQRTINRMKSLLDEKIGTAQWHLGTYPLELVGSFMGAAANLVNAASPEEIVYAEGPSLGLNLIAKSLPWQAGDNIAFCDLEHPANVYPWMGLEKAGVVIRLVPSVNGGLTLEALRQVVDERTKLVAASAIQFFTGHRTDLAAIGKFCRERNILFAVDAIQAVGHMPIDVQKMNIDMLVTGGHKSIMTMPSTGFMYVRAEVCNTLQPALMGSLSTADWPYYLKYDMTPAKGAWRFMTSTPNFVGMAGIVESIGLINELTREAINQHTTGLARKALEMARRRDYELTTTPGEHGPIANFKSKFSPDQTKAYLSKIEQEQGIAIATPLDRQGQVHLRLSFHCYNTEDELERAFAALDAMK